MDSQITDRQATFFRHRYFQMSGQLMHEDEIAERFPTKWEASKAINKLNEISKRWGDELKQKMEQAPDSERFSIATSGTMRKLSEDERKEVFGQ